MGKAPYSSRIKLGALDQGSPSLRFQSGISRPTFKNSVGDGGIRTHTTLRSKDFKSRESVLPNLTKWHLSPARLSVRGLAPPWRITDWRTHASRSEVERPTAHQRTGRSGRSVSSAPIDSRRRQGH